MKKIIVLLVVLLLIASTIQVAFATPPPDDPDNIGACHMGASVWEPGGGPGNANGVEDGERGMNHVHTQDMPDQVGDDGYTYGASNMDRIAGEHCDYEPPE